MNTRILRPLGISLFASLFLVAGVTFADEAAIKAGMKSRLPKVLSLKDAGTVGEGADGMLHPRAGLSKEGGKLVTAENTDRTAYYALKAKQTGGAASAVAKAMAKGFLARGKKGHWFRDAEGEWRQK